MKLDWREVCEHLHIPYATHGPSVVRNHIAIKCPFCGDADPSTHMGLSLDTSNPQWGCWRNAEHRGRHPLRLLVALTGNARTARELLREKSKLHPEDMQQQPSWVQPLRVAPGLVESDEWSKGFKALWQENYGVGPFLAYLRGRGFDDPQRVAKRYRLHYALSGRYGHRIIIPVIQNNALVAFTSRTIRNCDQRFLASGSGLKLTLANWDEIKHGGRTLVLCEGPFDFMKLDHYSEPLKEARGLRFTCGFGIGLSATQVVRLCLLIRRKYEAAIIAFDKGAETQAESVANQVREYTGKEVRVSTDTGEAEDAGAMTRNQVLDYVESLLRS